MSLGVLRIAGSRLAAYGWFERAILVSILLVQPFTFVDRQLAGLAALAGNLALLVTLRTMLGFERERSA